MMKSLIAIGLVATFAAAARGSNTVKGYYKKYNKKRPNCKNIKCYGFTSTTATMRLMCNYKKSCTGFSF